jgi:hypothetical protein
MRHNKSGTKAMKKTPDEPLKIAARNAPSLKTSAKAHVRYAGFESTESGRCLWFSVSAAGRESIRITIQVSDAAFTATRGISIQDAAPMAYEKIVALLATQDFIDSNELCLTDADITQYKDRHLSSQKRAFSESDRKRRFDIAA